MLRTLVLVVLLSSSLAAQTVESVIDLTTLGWGALDIPQSVEVDGDFTTREWLIRSLDTNAYRVVAERHGALCAGAWFMPKQTLFDVISLQRVGVTHRLIVRGYASALVRVIALDMPTGC